MSMKIGFLTERLLLGFGVDLVVHHYASMLVDKGYDVEVYCFRHEPAFDQYYKVVDLSAPGVLSLTGSMTLNILHFGEIFNQLDVDVWIVNTPPFYDVIPLLQKPVVAIEYGTPPSSFFAPEIGKNLDASVGYRFRYVFPRLRPQDEILCISRDIQNWLPKKVRGASNVLYLGCDHYPKADETEAREFREGLGLDEDSVVLLWVGRVQLEADEQPYKGFKKFVALADRACAAEPRLRIVVVGRGGEAEAEFLRSRGIVPRLNLPDAQMGAAFASADFFVSTSLWEGFNLPLLEAQYQGTPVIAYRLGPHPEVVNDGVTGVLVDDDEALLEAALTLTRDTDERARLAACTRAFADGFSWRKSRDGLEKAIQAVVSERDEKVGNDSPAVNVQGWGEYTFMVSDVYFRYGFLILLQRMAAFVRTRFSGVMACGRAS